MSNSDAHQLAVTAAQAAARKVPEDEAYAAAKRAFEQAGGDRTRADAVAEEAVDMLSNSPTAADRL